jgi:hypothetical protein
MKCAVFVSEEAAGHNVSSHLWQRSFAHKKCTGVEGEKTAVYI